MAKKWKDLVEDVAHTQDVIAKVVPKGDVHGFLKKDVIIDPGEAVVIIKNGKIEDVLTQTKLKDVGGGFGGWLERKLGKAEDELLLFMDTSPIDLELPLSATSSDYVETNGTCTMRVQLNTENATKIINLLDKEQVLTKTGLEDRIQGEAAAMVLSNRIAKHAAEEFHGNVDIIKEMETAAGVEMRKTFDLWGINLLKLWTNWEKGAYDEMMEYKQSVQMAEERRDADFTTAMGDLRRQHDAVKKQQEIDYDQAIQGERIEVGKEAMRREAETAADERELQMAMDAKKQMHEMKMDREKLGAETDVEKARLEVEKTKYDLDTYKEAEDRERDYQLKMTEQTAKLMQAAKQDMPRTLVQGGASAGVEMRQVDVEGGSSCPKCNASVPSGSKFCPECGEQFG